jgi:hypothetical protein
MAPMSASIRFFTREDDSTSWFADYAWRIAGNPLRNTRWSRTDLDRLMREAEGMAKAPESAVQTGK